MLYTIYFTKNLLGRAAAAGSYCSCTTRCTTRPVLSVLYTSYLIPSQVRCYGRLLLYLSEPLRCAPSRLCTICFTDYTPRRHTASGRVLLRLYEPPRAKPPLYFTPYTLTLRRCATMADSYLTSSRRCAVRPAVAVRYSLYCILY